MSSHEKGKKVRHQNHHLRGRGSASFCAIWRQWSRSDSTASRRARSPSSSAFTRTSSSVSGCSRSGWARGWASVGKGWAETSFCPLGAHWALWACAHASRSSLLIRHWFLLSRKARKSCASMARMIVRRETPATWAACAGDMGRGWACPLGALTGQGRCGWWQASRVPAHPRKAVKAAGGHLRSVAGVLRDRVSGYAASRRYPTRLHPDLRS